MEQHTTILAVDDDPDILAVLKANLEIHGFTVRVAADAGQAKKLFSPPPDLLLLDLNLPDGDGIAVCRDIKKRFPGLPVIMLTARDRVSDKVIGLDSGADDYVVKPFETLELLARVRACLRRIRPPATTSLSCGGLFLDPTQHSVTLNDRPLDLTPKEFDLLYLLMESHGKVLSREAIRRALWKDSNLYSWSRVIDVHIQHLRQKIEADPSSPVYIHTVPGVGYRSCSPE